MISIIMLTYNREDMVSKMIESILNQKFTDYELLIINNGSTDNTAIILNEYRKICPRIRIIEEKPMKIGAARNLGVKNSVGEYVLFVDDDDVLYENCLENLYNLSQKYKADVVIGGTEEKKIDGTIQPQCACDEFEIIPAQEAVKYLLLRKKIRAGTAGKLIRRQLYIKNVFPENSNHEDIYVMYKVLANANKVILSGCLCYQVLIHDNNISSFNNDNSRWTEDELQEYYYAFVKREQYIGSMFPELRDFAEYCTLSYEISMCNKLKSYRRDILNIFIDDINEKSDRYSKYLTEEEKKIVVSLLQTRGKNEFERKNKTIF